MSLDSSLDSSLIYIHNLALIPDEIAAAILCLHWSVHHVRSTLHLRAQPHRGQTTIIVAIQEPLVSAFSSPMSSPRIIARYNVAIGAAHIASDCERAITLCRDYTFADVTVSKFGVEIAGKKIVFADKYHRATIARAFSTLVSQCLKIELTECSKLSV